MEKLQLWIKGQEENPKYYKLQKSCLDNFGKELSYNSYMIALDKMGYQLKKVDTMSQKKASIYFMMN